MAQHDYVIDNSTGANVRADINNVLQAIASNNSGSSAPSTTYAFQFFANTTTSKLQIRNSANDGFVDLLGLDGTISLPDGSNSAPSLAFSDDTNTGIFSSAADTFNITTGGVEKLELGATTIFNDTGADIDFRIEGDTEENLFFVNAGTNHIGIGTNSPTATFEIVEAASTVAQKIKMGTNTNQNVHLELENDATSDLRLGVFGSSASTNGIINDSDGFISSTDDLCIESANASGKIKFGIGSGGSTQLVTITHSGHLLVGGTTNSMGGRFEVTGDVGFNDTMIGLKRTDDDTSNRTFMSFRSSDGSQIGSIGMSSSNVSFNTSSDYRLKENAVTISDAISKVKQLKPYTFNFKDDSSTKIDGFFAHEAQEVVSYAVSGEKDAERMQSMDYGKLTPLLTAALQAAITEIESLKAKLDAAGL